MSLENEKGPFRDIVLKAGLYFFSRVVEKYTTK
jgi:hypothetical protein